jgi:hypothetical protein
VRLRCERQNESFKKKRHNRANLGSEKKNSNTNDQQFKYIHKIHVLVRDRQFKRQTSTLNACTCANLKFVFSPRIYCLFRILNVPTNRQTDVKKKKNSIPSIKSITESNQSRKTTSVECVYNIKSKRNN